MTHYRMSDRDPSAVIMAKNPRTGSLEELKIYIGNIVYLQDRQEFQLRLFNPTHEKLGVQINLNGKINDQVLILNPGQDYTIDRFLNEQKKMLFETYSIDGGNASAKKAIELNGLVEINFFKEQNHSYTTTTTGVNNIQFGSNFTITNSNSRCYDSGTINLGDMNQMRTTTKETDNSIFFSSDLGDVQTGDLTIDGGDLTTDSLTIEGDLTVTGDLNLTSSQKLSSKGKGKGKRKRISKSIKSEKVETGRVEKGKISNQNFQHVEVEFDTNSPILTLNYQLKPISSKTYEVKEIRNYCLDCGYRIRKQSWMYCPKCGEEL